jgi:hypothetical protein
MKGPQILLQLGLQEAHLESELQTCTLLLFSQAAPPVTTNYSNFSGGRPVQGVTLDGREIKMYPGGTGGAPSRPLGWAAGGGSTKPPMVDNYLDSHGFHAGLGNSAKAKFPSVVESRPLQVSLTIKHCN